MPQKQKPLSQKELEAVRHIRTAMMHGAQPSVRDLQEKLGYKSPRSAADILDQLKLKGVVRRRADGRLQLVRDPEGERRHARTVDIPIVGTAPCGAALLAEENIEGTIPVSMRLAKPPHRYFLIRAVGDSMNEAGINNGDHVLVKQQPTADNGDRVVALIDDKATIKEFQRRDIFVILQPKSNNKKHKPILLTEDFQIQGVVVSAIPKLE
jgi:repressor LexA